MPMTRAPLRDLAALGQSVWIDDLSRDLLEEGRLAPLIRRDGVAGVAWSPAAARRALGQGAYDEQLAELGRAVRDPKERLMRLAARDARHACNLLMATWLSRDGRDGHVSVEVDPRLAGDAPAIIEEAERIRSLVRRPNLLVKIPATPAGLIAGEELLARGRSVHFALIASPARHLEVAEAHLRGIERLAADGGDPRRVVSVAGVAVSRIDAEADRRLERLGGHEHLRGRLGIATAKLASRASRRILADDRWAALAASGARPQRCLWAPAAATDPAGSDVRRDLRYVEALIGPGTVAAVPEETLRAFVRHGRVAPTLERDPAEAERMIELTRRAGIDPDDVAATLERDGLAALEASFRALLRGLRRTRDAAPAPGGVVRPARPAGGLRVVVLRTRQPEPTAPPGL
jgi:transaldolase